MVSLLDANPSTFDIVESNARQFPSNADDVLFGLCIAVLSLLIESYRYSWSMVSDCDVSICLEDP